MYKPRGGNFILLQGECPPQHWQRIGNGNQGKKAQFSDLNMHAKKVELEPGKGKEKAPVCFKCRDQCSQCCVGGDFHELQRHECMWQSLVEARGATLTNGNQVLNLCIDRRTLQDTCLPCSNSLPTPGDMRNLLQGALKMQKKYALKSPLGLKKCCIETHRQVKRQRCHLLDVPFPFVDHSYFSQKEGFIWNLNKEVIHNFSRAPTPTISESDEMSIHATVKHIDEAKYLSMGGLTECDNKKHLYSEEFKLNSSVYPEGKKIGWNAKIGSSQEDDDYRRFLELLREDRSLNSLDNDADVEYEMFLNNRQEDAGLNDSDDDADVGYDTFLNHLREDGTSYVLEMINSKNGKMVSLKYEGEDEPSQIKLETLTTPSSTLNEGKVVDPSEDSLKSVMLCPTNLRRNGRSCQKIVEKEVPSALAGCCKTGCSSMEVDYRLFVEHVRLQGESYVLDLRGKDGTVLSINYEEETALHTWESESVVLKKQDSQMKSTEHNISSKRRSVCSDNCCQTKGLLGPRLIQKEEKANNELVPCKTESWSKRLPMKSSSDLKEIFNAASPGHSSDSLVYKDDEDVIGTRNDSSHFEENLNAVLARPYDQNEYQELWNEVTRRTPVKGARELRGRFKSYETENMGLSYLDHFPDLKKQIQLADCREALSLLRGFFFWLKNVCYHDAIMPWCPYLSNVESESDSDCRIIEH